MDKDELEVWRTQNGINMSTNHFMLAQVVFDILAIIIIVILLLR